MALSGRAPPTGKETVQQTQPPRPPAALAVGAGVGSQLQRAGRGDQARFHPLDRPERRGRATLAAP
jgi:hypothetical protein